MHRGMRRKLLISQELKIVGILTKEGRTHDFGSKGGAFVESCLSLGDKPFFEIVGDDALNELRSMLRDKSGDTGCNSSLLTNFATKAIFLALCGSNIESL